MKQQLQKSITRLKGLVDYLELIKKDVKPETIFLKVLEVAISENKETILSLEILFNDIPLYSGQ